MEYVELDEFMTGKKNLCDNAPEGGKKICDNKVVVVHELVEYEMWYEFITGGIRKLYDDALEEGKKIYDNIDEQYLFKSTS